MLTVGRAGLAKRRHELEQAELAQGHDGRTLWEQLDTVTCGDQRCDAAMRRRGSGWTRRGVRKLEPFEALVEKPATRPHGPAGSADLGAEEVH